MKRKSLGELCLFIKLLSIIYKHHFGLNLIVSTKPYPTCRTHVDVKFLCKVHSMNINATFDGNNNTINNCNTITSVIIITNNDNNNNHDKEIVLIILLGIEKL